MDDADGQSCESCRYWVRSAAEPGREEQTGDCRRYPLPLCRDAAGVVCVGQWPLTWAAQWCGEYRPRQ